jgi:3-hydroxyacyl-[acyl-carrier-protein] dehydratase
MIQEIYQKIPHRPPFLFVDEVVSINENGIEARRQVRPDEPHFEGHYPGNPIMPGVLLCESIFQTAAIYMAHREADGESDRTPILARILEAKFKRMVRPGDLLSLFASYSEGKGGFHFMTGKATVEGKLAVSVSFALALVSENKS